MAARALSILAAGEDEPSRAAVVSGGRTLSFAELALEARRSAAWLREQGVEPGARVALVPRLDTETITMIHALVALGAPIVFLHPRLRADERQALVADSSPALVIEDVRAASEAVARHAPLSDFPAEPDEDATLAILYTSGTTGRPKGTMLARRAFVASARASAANLGWREDDRWLLCMPLAHVGGLSIVLRCLLARRTVALPSAEQGFDPARLLADATATRATILSLV